MDTEINPLPSRGWVQSWARYLFAVALSGLVILLRYRLGSVFSGGYMYVLFYPAVLLVAVLCGSIPSLLATGLMALFAACVLLRKPLEAVSALSLSLFVVSGILLSILAGLYRRSRGALQEVAARRQMEAALQQSRSELAEDLQSTTRLHQLAARYVSQHDMAEILDEIVDAAIVITHAAKGNLQLFDASAGGLRIAAAKGFSKPWLDYFQLVDRNAASCAEAMRQRKRIVVEDVGTSSIFAGTPGLEVQLKEGVRAIQSTPLISRSGELLGMISTHFAEPHLPKDRELHRLDLLARQAADLLESKRAEEALREREAVLRTVTSDARVGLVLVNRDRRYLFANQTYSDIFRLNHSDLVGRRVSDVVAHLYDQIKPHLDRAFSGERVTYELRMPPKEKSDEERFYQMVYEPRVESVAEPYVVVVVVDITERKRMQQTLEQTVAERTARLRETVLDLESFSYSIAHDMRAPLRAMHGFANLLQEDYTDKLDELGQEYLRRISLSARRMDQLIQDVLDYSKIVRDELPLQTVQTGEMIRQIIDTYPNLHPPQAEIVLEEPMPPIRANAAAFTQVVSNLLGNALKFVEPGVKPHVRVWSEERAQPADSAPSAPKSSQDPALAPAEPHIVRLWFQDNGIGIGKDSQDRIFQMFQRLNPPGKYEGTGIGLTIVRKAVERMGGNVGVESEPGKGSRFWVELQEAA